MRIGTMMVADGTGATLDDVIGTAKRVEAAGLDSAWLANIFSFDAISTLALNRAGDGTPPPRYGGNPHLPAPPDRHRPAALTTQAACNGRFTLGIGLSHQIVIETMLGLSYERRAAHMREYLSVPDAAGSWGDCPFLG